MLLFGFLVKLLSHNAIAYHASGLNLYNWSYFFHVEAYARNYCFTRF